MLIAIRIKFIFIAACANVLMLWLFFFLRSNGVNENFYVFGIPHSGKIVYRIRRRVSEYVPDDCAMLKLQNRKLPRIVFIIIYKRKI